MPTIRTLLLLVLLLGGSGAAFAQTPAARQSIQQQMSPADFKAAGLDKLSAQELANLDAWLNRTIDTETTQAAAVARKKLEDDSRGFFNFGSSEPVVSKIVGEFRGFQKGRNYILANGQEWEQVDNASLVGVRKNDPGVKITPSLVGNAWYLAIDGYNTRAKVQRVK